MALSFATLKEILPNIPIYYAHPYLSFERGTNEKQNSIVREFLSKGKSFNNISDDVISRIKDWIKNFPRKPSIITPLLRCLFLSYLILQFRNFL